MNSPQATDRLPRPPSPDIADHHWAWFLDVDGTLLELERRPDLVSADRRLLELLDRLYDVYGGAVALISGRSLAQLDRIFGTLRIAAGASHGLELRPTADEVTVLGEAVPPEVAEEISAFVEGHAGLILERKSYSVGVHFRERPDLATEVATTMEKAARELDNRFRLQHGKKMIELLSIAAGKGGAIRAFMQRAPFEGRRPVFVGDDVTDEHGFATVNEFGGLSIRIGDAQETVARWRLENVAELRTWLRAAINLI